MKNKTLKVKGVKTLVPEQLKKISAAKEEGVWPCDSNLTCLDVVCHISTGTETND